MVNFFEKGTVFATKCLRLVGVLLLNYSGNIYIVMEVLLFRFLNTVSVCALSKRVLNRSYVSETFRFFIKDYKNKEKRSLMLHFL